MLSLYAEAGGAVLNAATAPDREHSAGDVHDPLIEEVVVTGSRLIRSNLDSPSPVNLVVGGRQTDTPFLVDDYMQLDLQYRYESESLNGGM